MRRETALLIGFLFITIGTAAGLWYMAMPNFRPMSFPTMESGTISIGPMRAERPLTAAQVHALNDWMQAHTKGWGPLGQTPPSSGDAVLEMQVAPPAGQQPQAGGQPAPYRITLWTGISAADWNNTVFVEEKPGAVIRFHHYKDKDFNALRDLVNQYDYPRSAFP
ncbi:hypothetical protein SXCC_03387 [Gluconacetobacter sp. SXCC-1]|uniref:Uncharacterized protein n=1 Tax=Komagataeibacter rhaeticus TaxID=215221 RepID=A0A181C8E2_9PROT|nr:hypothetical protein [Komagataeibacter rhaeticus]ATU73398.1 hypothetical protein CT154_11840 [Komagataeibacter xylinus]EGG76027.1 hypothetical protein SXCC_03387 [Gluconacetobacter sp. SXCC-1]QIP34769.1 hypothetical protein GWK63_04030 [Komagataeibacter rhaeticus]QOC47297.1 hypothetical protein ICJ78_04030 [Komagataeibacter rhaeticus]WPP23306.1 hypothetical protein SCD25_07605 [Komagataeibacter rhaeticus]